MTDKARISSDGRKANSTPPICDDTGCEMFMLAMRQLASSGSQLEATQSRRRPQNTAMLSQKSFPKQLFDLGKEPPALQRHLPPRSWIALSPTVVTHFHIHVWLQLPWQPRLLPRAQCRRSLSDTAVNNLPPCQRSAPSPATALTTAMTPSVPAQRKHHQHRTMMLNGKGARSPSVSPP